MNFEYIKIPQETTCAMREKFIATFVDTTHDLYVRYIRDIRANDTVKIGGLVVSFLWSCLQKNKAYIIDFYAAMRYIHQLENMRVLVMWDIRPEKVVYPESWRAYSVYTPPCELLLKSDEMISIEPKELCEVLLHDHHIEEHRIRDISQYFLRDDVYIFDETCTWYVALTHEKHNQKRLCFSNIQEINSLVLQ